MLVSEVIGVLGLALCGLVVGRLIGLPAVPSYLVIGVLAGPGGARWLTHSPTLDQLAEVGVALLLFGVGIEFSLDRLRRRLWRMGATGALQVGLTVTAAAATVHLAGTPLPTAIFLGFLVALSSTAIVGSMPTRVSSTRRRAGPRPASCCFRISRWCR